MSRWRMRTWDQVRWAHERQQCSAVHSLDTLPAIPDARQLRALAASCRVPAPCHRYPDILPVRYPHILVGLWRCSCSFIYRGHLLQLCPLCGRVPRIVRCYTCGLTTKLPEPYHDETD